MEVVQRLQAVHAHVAEAVQAVHADLVCSACGDECTRAPVRSCMHICWIGLLRTGLWHGPIFEYFWCLDANCFGQASWWWLWVSRRL